MSVYPDSYTLTAGSDITADLIQNSWSIRRGIMGNKPTDLVASVGTFVFELDNSASNSNSTLGYYSPDHASYGDDIDIGQAVTFDITVSAGARRQFTGTIVDVSPSSGPYAERRVTVTAVDDIDRLSYQKVDGLAVLTDTTADEIIDDAIGSGASGDTGLDIFPYALDTEQDEKTAKITVIQKAVQSTGMGYFHIDENGVPFFRNRHFRLNHSTDYAETNAYFSDAAGTAWGTLTSVGIQPGSNFVMSRDDVINKVECEIYKRRVDSSSTVLAKTNADEFLAPGETKTITMRYVDANNEAQRVSGMSMVTPVNGTDYKFSTVEDSDTNDLSGSLTVTPTFGGNSAEIELTSSAVVGGYVWLQLRGIGLYQYNPVTIVSEDATSISAYGEKTLRLKMPYQTNVNVAQAIADYIVDNWKDPKTRANSITFIANESSHAMSAATLANLSDFVRVDESVIGLSSEFFFLNGVELRGVSNLIFSCTLYLAPADTTSYFKLDTSYLDGAHILAP